MKFVNLVMSHTSASMKTVLIAAFCCLYNRNYDSRCVLQFLCVMNSSVMFVPDILSVTFNSFLLHYLNA